MKTVGKQLQEARLARNWTPELASRETKIKVERLKDLEADDYSHFNNATYARGFVRTYARALGLDEYKILRQLDNKLPDDDTANIVSAEGGVAYLPETAMPPRVAHRDFTGLYIVMGSGAVVMLIIAFVLFRAYQVGELGHWTGEDTASSGQTTNAASAVASDAAPRAKPIDSDTPPPIPEPVTNAVAATPAPDAAPAADTAPKALPVDPSTLTTANTPAPSTAPAVEAATPTPRALPVDPSTLTAANNVTPSTPPTADAPTPTPTPTPRALPVDPSALTPAAPSPAPEAVSPAPSAPASTDIPAPRALPVDPSTLNAPSASTAPADNATADAPKALPVSPADLAAASNPSPAPAPDNGPVIMPPPSSAPATDEAKPLVLTASHDSFVKVTMLDPDSGDKPVYAAVLHSGQSVSFDGHKFSVAVDNPSAVDIKLDGVNYGPHDDGTDPETFTVVSHE